MAIKTFSEHHIDQLGNNSRFFTGCFFLKNKRRNNMIFLCYPKCTTCQKAQKWLDNNGLSYELRNIKENNPTLEELKKWHKMSGLPLKKFFNTSGLIYKSLKLKDKLLYGRTYTNVTADKDAGIHVTTMWICPVTLFVLGRYPNYIYIKRK